MRLRPWLLPITLCLAPAFAQPPGAILMDGPGPWRNSNWTLAVTEFSSLLSDAGYTVQVVPPEGIRAALTTPNILLAAPSLAGLPADTLDAIADYLFFRGGNLLATGGEPFSNRLYQAPDGSWVDAATYQQLTGSLGPLPPAEVAILGTLSPWNQQYTNSAGLRVPIARPRGISSATVGDNRYRAIGDLLAPSATLFIPTIVPAASYSYRGLIVWLPWPQLQDPLRGELVSALNGARYGIYIANAGPDQIVWLPGEDVTGLVNVTNIFGFTGQATLAWSIAGPAGVTPQPDMPLTFTNTPNAGIRLDLGRLPAGDYTLQFRLRIAGVEVDRIDSPVRVLDPTLTRRPDQKIRAVNGAFYAGGQRVFLQGVNYWPRNVGAMWGWQFGDSWLEPVIYDPDLVEADLALLESLDFNLVNIEYVDSQPNWLPQARSLIDFLERCRNHGIWVRISMPALLGDNAFGSNVSPSLGAYLDAALLPGNDRVFAYELLWEPYFGGQNSGGYGGLVNGTYVYDLGRSIMDPSWRSWVNDRYGSLAAAETIWGLTAPRDDSGQLTNPTDDQLQNDGPWRTMVAAYRRFAEDYLGRNLGRVARQIHRADPDTLLTYRNGATMTAAHNAQMGYDIGTAAAHLDFFSPENYDGSSTWPDDRKWGLVTAYSRFRTGGKPVQWTEFGSDIGPYYGTPDSRAAQATLCDTIMRQVNDDGSNAASVWWWPGGGAPNGGPYTSQPDFGIIDPDGTPRGCALSLAQWATQFAAAPPDMGPGSPVKLTVDRDADARGEYGLFLNFNQAYVHAREAGQPVVLVDAGTGADTATMPLIQVGNAPHSGVGPLKFANAEFGDIRVVCPNLEVTVDNGGQVAIPPGAACQIMLSMVNTGEALWLPTTAAAGGVQLHTNIGNIPLTTAVPSLGTVSLPPLAFTMGQNIVVTGRLSAQGAGDFGEALNLILVVDTTAIGHCVLTLNLPAVLSAPAAGASGTIAIGIADGCIWYVVSLQPWLTLTPGVGNGAGTVNYTIQANPGPARQTFINIAGRAFTVTQAAADAKPPASQAMLSAVSLNFSAQTIGTTSAGQTVTLAITGGVPSGGLSIAVGGMNGADFAQTNSCGVAGDACTINVSFTPSAPGLRTATLFLNGNIAGAPLMVNLSGMGAATGPAPAIQAIADSWDYTSGIAPGLWVTIAGTNLGTAPQGWNLTGVQQLPITLGGASVTFNGTPAALSYVSSTQINALVPASVAPGAVQVVAQVDGVNSSPFTITATATQPAVYAPPKADGSAFFVTAALQGTAFLVGNRPTDTRVMRAVYPGDVLDLYMIGLGATADRSKFITDRLFTGAFPLTAQVTATIGSEAAPVQFAGLISPGLYLVRILVPSDIPPGQQPIQISTGNPSDGGVQTRAALLLTVQAASANLVQNGSFESAVTGTWDLNATAGATASFQRTTSTAAAGASSAQVTVTSAANLGAVQLAQSGLPALSGQVYRLLFWAKADTARTIGLTIAGNGAGAANEGLNSSAALTGDWQKYVFYFQATATGSASQLSFACGDETGNIWIDGVELRGTQ